MIAWNRYIWIAIAYLAACNVGGRVNAQGEENISVATTAATQPSQSEVVAEKPQRFSLSDLLVSGPVIAHREPSDLYRDLEDAFQVFDSTVRDYTAVMVKRERLAGHLSSHQVATLKVREPRSEGDVRTVSQAVYMKFLRPRFLSGREILYVEDQRDGRLLARKGGLVFSSITTLLPIDHPLATCESNYLITNAGLRFTFQQAMDTLRANMDKPENRLCEFKSKVIDRRTCRHFELRLAEKSSDVPYHFVRLLFDDELKLPMYVATYRWNEDAEESIGTDVDLQGATPNSVGELALTGERPQDRSWLEKRAQKLLLEEFWFTKIELNPGLSEQDFAPAHPDYDFKLKKD